jgi:Flp pilus assembly protein protease CpaA
MIEAGPREVVVAAIALFYLVIGTIEDFKTREVMNFSNFSLLALGFAVNLSFAASHGDWMIMLECLAGYAAFVAVAFLMYYTGQWGGGDSKMLMGLGALIGLQFNFSGLPFLLDFLINIFIFGAAYGMLWSLVLSIFNWKKVSSNISKKMKVKKVRLIKNIMLASSAVMILAAILIRDILLRISIVSLSLALLMGFYLWIFIKSIEKVMMHKLLPIEKLTEGDWVVDEIKIDGKVICGPKDLGLERKQIDLLLKAKKEKKIDKVKVKEGIPFVPSFLIAFIVTIFFRNLWMFFLKP